MRFAFPYAFVLLPLVPLLVYWAHRRHRLPAFGFPSVIGLDRLPQTWATRLLRALPYLRALALASCIVALARPQWGVEATRIYSEGISIAMVVDISSSMGALDLQIDEKQANRLDVVKRTFRDFLVGDDDRLEGREGDLIGLISFARYADSLTPLTLDHDALLALLEQVEIVPFPEEDGTAIGDAIARTLDILRQASGASKVMILLTDGSSNAGDVDPVAAAQAAEALGIRIYTIGAGSRGLAPIPVRNQSGGMEIRRSQVFIDEHTLMQVADLTGGRYFRATDARALRDIYEQIDAMETGRTIAEHYQQYIEGFPVFVLLAFLLIALETALTATRLRTAP